MKRENGIKGMYLATCFIKPEPAGMRITKGRNTRVGDEWYSQCQQNEMGSAESTAANN